MKRVLLFLLLSNLTLYSQTLTLESAQKLLFKNNNDILIALLETEISQNELKIAVSQRLPSLDISGSYSFVTEKSKMQLAIGPPLGTIEKEIGTNDKAEIGLDLSIPLFTGFMRYHSIEAAKSKVRSKEAMLSELKDRLSLLLGIRFLAWNLAIKQKAAINSQIERLVSYLSQAEDLYKAGVVGRSKVLETRSRLATARSDLATAEAKEDSLKRDFQKFTGIQTNSFTPLVSDTIIEAQISTHYENAHQSLESFSFTSQQIEENRKALNGKKLPNLFFLAGYRYSKPGLNLGTSDFMGYGIAGLQLQWNLFDGFRNHSQQQNLILQNRKIEQQRAQREYELRNEFEDAIANIEQSTVQVRAAALSLEAAKELSEDLKNSYDAGIVTSSDYLNALAAETLAQFTFEVALNKKRIALLLYRYASGNTMDFEQVPAF